MEKVRLWGLPASGSGWKDCKRFGLLLLLLATLQLPAQAATNSLTSIKEVVARARVMISLGEYDQAYRFMAPYEPIAADHIDFNYLFGLAALDSGRPSQAVFPLQRALLLDPDYSAARIELARAQYELGDYEAAEAEFQLLQTQNPPVRARIAINNYLTAIQRKSARYRPGFGYYFQVGAGYDSNANGATDVDQFLNFRLSDRSRSQSSAYIDLNYGGDYHFPIDHWYQLVMAAGFHHRRLPSAGFVDLDRARAHVGFKFDDDRLQLTTLLVGSYTQLDGSFNNNDIGVEIGLQSLLSNPHWRFLGNLRLARVSYDDDISIQDVDQGILSLGFEWAENEGKFRRLGAVGIVGRDSARESGSPYSRSQLGFRIFGSRQLDERLWLLGQGGALFSDYDGDFFGEQRDDALYQVVAALAWQPFKDPRWSLQPHLAYYKNDSDVDIFEYDRTELGLTLVWSSQ